MAITIDNFAKVWASQSPLTPYEFSESQYKEGWNFIGGTPPSRQMWDFLQKNNDEKMQYLADNYLPLSGGTMTGQIRNDDISISSSKTNSDGLITINGGYNPNTGAQIVLIGENFTGNPGSVIIRPRNRNGYKELYAYVDGRLTWGGNNILTAGNYNNYALPLSGGTLTGEVNGVTPTAGDNSTKLATTAFVKTAVEVVLPTGVVQAYAGTTIPTGWLLCDGSAVSRTTYANLFACIGTTYGSGDGSTTFNLPNLIDKFIEGNATAGTVKNAGLPNITGQIGQSVTGSSGGGFRTESIDISGALAEVETITQHYGSSTASLSTPKTVKSGITIDASRSNSIYGNSNTVQPPALTMKYIIKY